MFYFYIKPQQRVAEWDFLQVVSYSISTSNHNNRLVWDKWRDVVSYSISTSNHNYRREPVNYELLFLILFLHQTTTERVWLCRSSRCFLFYFYIKPQLLAPVGLNLTVVSYSISTSNHNLSIHWISV